MIQLLLLRHAHAEEAPARGSDIDRPLSPRGRTEALDAAKRIVKAHLTCDRLLVSTAVRTRQTARIVAAELKLTEPPQFDPLLYLGDADTLLSVLHRGADAATLLLVGHNPGISELAQRFHGTAPPVLLRTAGLCRVAFDAKSSWNRLQPRHVAEFELLR
jgi:phosphohistidine phosphatase